MKFFSSSKSLSPTFVKYFLLVCGIAFVGIFIWNRTYSYVSIEIGGEQFEARVADTISKRTKGLSGSRPLEKNDAMLFVFQTPDQYSFWMKGMSFPIDIIWVDAGKIVDIAPRVPPPVENQLDSELMHYTSRLPARMVIEVVSGTADRLGLKIGDEVKFQE